MDKAPEPLPAVKLPEALNPVIIDIASFIENLEFILSKYDIFSSYYCMLQQRFRLTHA